jgi:hypothetical protein
MTSDVSTLTVLDLWYTAKGSRTASFSYADVLGEPYDEADDWFACHMRRVAQEVFTKGHLSTDGGFRGMLVLPVHPYTIAMSFANSTQTLHVSVFLKEEPHGSAHIALPSPDAC